MPQWSALSQTYTPIPHLLYLIFYCHCCPDQVQLPLYLAANAVANAATATAAGSLSRCT